MRSAHGQKKGIIRKQRREVGERAMHRKTVRGRPQRRPGPVARRPRPWPRRTGGRGDRETRGTCGTAGRRGRRQPSDIRITEYHYV